MRALAPLLLASFAFAQQPAAEPFGHSRHGAEFDEGPRQAAYLMPGMNAEVHFPVHGLTGDAQRYFDQGITQQHGFWYFEAERSFRQVAMLQPECALAYWGMAMANVENIARAAGFAAQAVQRAVGLPEREKLYVDAIAALYQIDEALRTELQSGDGPRVQKAKDDVVARNGKDRDEKKLRREFLRGLEAVVAACPDDGEAKAFLAIQSWHNQDHDLAISSHGAVDALLDQVFGKAPRHPAHHYRVHLWDDEKPARALPSAAALGDSAPGIAHQWHMAGHIYAGLDRHAEAAWQQEASGRVDHAHMQRDRVLPFLIHNYAHNQEWWARSLSYVGRAADALAAAKNLVAIPRHPKHNKLDDRIHAAGYGRRRIVQVCEDYELWADAVQLAADGYLDASDSVWAEVQRLGLLGRALFRQRRFDEAQRIVPDVDSLLAKARAQRAAAVDKAEDEAFAQKTEKAKTRELIAEAGREPTDSVESVLDLRRELRGEELLASGDAKGALEQFEAVKDFPKTLLGDAFVAAGQPEKAVELLEKEVKEHPHRVPTLGRLFIAYAAMDKPEHKERLRELMCQLPWIPEGQQARTPLEARIDIGVGIGRGFGPVTRNEAAFGDDFGPRPPLGSLGPIRWQPFANAGFELRQVRQLEGDKARRLSLQPDGTTTQSDAFTATATWKRPTLVVFYLGFGCVQCVEQLQLLRTKAAQFVAAGIDVVAIGTDSVDVASGSHLAMQEAERFPFPLLGDPELGTFRTWRCFDDFEQMPLHGTFVVDSEGLVRWQDVSAEPFTQFDWLLAECSRLLARGGDVGHR